MTQPKFKLGDLVKSNAGSVKMSVDAISNLGGEPKYWCIWWVGQKRSREQFTESGLEPWVDKPTEG